MLLETLNALGETLTMVLISGLICALIGLPLGVILNITQAGRIWEKPKLNFILGMLVNATRSIPFIILMLAIIPLTRLITGSSIGLYAAIVPLSFAAIPFFARVVETALNEVSDGLIEAGHAMGATPFQIIQKILIPESRAGIVSGLTLTLVNLIGYSAMAGAIGGGGLGSLAYHYGYQRFDTMVMLTTVLILILLVQSLQSIGDYLARHL